MAARLYCTKITGKSFFIIKFIFCSYFTFSIFQNLSEPSKILSHGAHIALARCLKDKNNPFNL